MGIYAHPNRSWFETDAESFQKVVRQLTREGYLFVNHNIKFDLGFLRHHGWVDDSFDYYFDTRTVIPLLPDRPASSSLEPAAVHYLKVYPWKDSVAHKNMEFEDIERVKEYAIRDCVHTCNLSYELINQLAATGLEDFYFNRLLPLDKELAKASMRGIRIDREFIQVKKEEYARKIAEKTEAFRTKYAGLLQPFETLMLGEKLASYKSEKGKEKALQNPPKINLRSNAQILQLLKDFAGIKMLDPNGKPSVGTDAMFLNSDHEIVRDLMELRDLDKPPEFFEVWETVADQNDRVHTTFNTDIARTGRLSSSGDANVQQIPTRKDPSIRKCFTAAPGHKLVIRDLASIEPRILAHYSQDPGLLEVFHNGWSLYGVIASRIGIWDGDPEKLKKENPVMYSVAKTVTLGVLYGMGARKMAFALRKATGEEFSTGRCLELIEAFFQGFPAVQKLRDQAIRRAESVGYLRNLFGRRVYVPKERAYTTAMNSLIQSSASDFMCFSQLALVPKLDGLGAKLLLLVHDECLWECPDPTAFEVDKQVDLFISDYAKSVGLRVPITTEGGVSVSWGDKRIDWKEAQ